MTAFGDQEEGGEAPRIYRNLAESWRKDKESAPRECKFQEEASDPLD